MDWYKLKISKSDSLAKMNEWDSIPKPDIEIQWQDLRQDMVNIMKCICRKLDIDETRIQKAAYAFDFNFAIELYKILNEKYGMNVRIASENSIWRAMSIKVIPDIVYHRWRFNEDRYWRRPQRIWLKTLWWYIYLSWQGDYKTTYDIIKENTTDEIVQMVERVGSRGYRVDLYRSIMRYYNSIDYSKNKAVLFRRVMKLNTAMIRTVEPSLFKGGVDGYSKEIFEYFNEI